MVICLRRLWAAFQRILNPIFKLILMFKICAAPPFSQCPSSYGPHPPTPLPAYSSSSLLYFSPSPTPSPRYLAPRFHHIPTRPLPSDPPYHSAVTPTLASDSDTATSPPHHCKPAHADRSPVPAAPGPNTGPYRRYHTFRPSSSPPCACYSPSPSRHAL